MIRENAPIEPNGSRFDLETAKHSRVSFGDTQRFRPQAQYSPFDDGAGCIFGLATQKNITPVLDKGSVIWTDGDTQVRFYEHAERDRWSKGAIETEVWLGVKPPKPEIPFLFEPTGIALHEQPALSQWEIDRGNTRPPDMVGGIVAYHSTKGVMHFVKGDAARYQTGKAFDLPRPTATDSHGSVVFGVWRHEPQNLLLVAVFDEAQLAALDWSDIVRVGPTIGYTTLGASNDGTGAFALANSYTAGATSDGGAATAFYGGANQSVGTVYLALYAFGDGNISGESLIAASSAITLDAGGNEFKSAAISPGTISNGTTYFIENYSNVAGTTTAYDNTGATNQYTATTVSTPPATHATRGGTQVITPSGYVDFTEAAGGAVLGIAPIVQNYRNMGL